ncbi:AraC family transcriptional regulator [Nocardioides sp. CFH 31398]|uniref:AraC family transcriptional regulator n=1 Tax=Nocardioides sp. CFH 31398 TaxID=2919579 RepID=UPI001F06705D|nr:AraC family transcriptional regulator [Nocardioides sp. CFH 31398]MCH1866177.1 AraC family transcriptional regulator [Nocardioides sp. CFH 31398]
MPALLQRHARLRTSDLDEARRRIGEVYCSHRLDASPRGGELDVVHNLARVGDVGVHYLRYGTEAHIAPEPLTDFYMVLAPLAGRARVTSGDEVVVSDRHRASLLSPGRTVDMSWSPDCEQLLVYLPRALVEAAARPTPDLGPTAPVRFAAGVDLDSPSVRGWWRLVHLAVDELELGGGLLTSDLAAQSLQQSLVVGLLAAQPNDSTLAPERAEPRVASLAVRTVRELIESRPEHPWTLADLAAQARCAPRTLQLAFRRERGQGPMAELRAVRLARAHADLLAADPRTGTVTEIAARWGFFHLSRFAAAYRARYGLLPSEALGRD